MGVLRLVNDEDLRRAAADAERAREVQAAAITRALDERGAASPGGGRLLPEAIAVRASTAPDRLTRRVEELRLKAARSAEAEAAEADATDATGAEPADAAARDAARTHREGAEPAAGDSRAEDVTPAADPDAADTAGGPDGPGAE
ncbi:hypothetical protein POF50_025170 [Streptomyces sp. SL13]|uniref:Uncharacterized protein n=1 Tax=Streptantibioticus silvisoli TaxID=2705255 RepID=A0AA90HCW6_9ACTN|nr:hypothetical protein [Streptantibioticus silvisoli]MDI5972592.1 hypothetical protein [Streptantibioticus silvisoli]